MQSKQVLKRRDRLSRYVLTGFVTVALFLVAPALRADEIFVQLADVRGGSQAPNYEGAIEASSWAWGMSQSGGYQMGSGGTAGRVQINNLTFAKFVDMASPVLMQLCASARPIKSARISLRHPGAKAPYMVIDLEGVMVASISTSGERESGRASEAVSLNFAKVRLSYSKDGRSADTQFGWSVVENKAL